MTHYVKYRRHRIPKPGFDANQIGGGTHIVIPAPAPPPMPQRAALSFANGKLRATDSGQTKRRWWTLERRQSANRGWVAVVNATTKRELLGGIAAEQPGTLDQSVIDALESLPDAFEHGALAMAARRC